MKKLTVAIIALFVALQVVAGNVIKNPKIEYSPSWMVVTEVELTAEATIVRGILGPGCSIVNNSILADRNTGKEYKFLRVEGIGTYQAATEPTSCSVFFEPVAEGVEEVNYIEVGNHPMGNFYGISLKQNENEAKAEVYDYDYYMKQPFTPNENWHFSNEPYKRDITSGKAQVKIHIGGIPRELEQFAGLSLTASVQNQLTAEVTVVSAERGEDNWYTLDLDLPYAQHVYIESCGNFFIMPRDTLEVFASIETIQSRGQIRPTSFRSKRESAVINAILPTLEKQYGKDEFDYKKAEAMIAEGKEATQPTLERWAKQVNEILTDKEFRQALIKTPLSRFGKDVVMMSVLAQKCINIEDVVSRYCYGAQIQKQLDNGNWETKPNPDYVPLDLNAIFGVVTENKALLFDNPIAICEKNQWVFINRMLYSVLLYHWEDLRDENGNFIGQRLRDDYGMAGTFMKDLRISQSAAAEIKYMQKNMLLKMTEEEKKEEADYEAYTIGGQLAEIRNASVARALVGKYRDFVKATEGGVSDNGNGWTAEQNALWEKVVGPYKGNVLFLDFWGMGCAPCRSGMLSQKSKVEALKELPAKFLYINQAPQQQAAEQWMGEKEIKGEHVFVTPDEWNLFTVMISFQGIPRGVLVDKNGKAIDKDFHIGNFSVDDLKKLIEKL